MKAIITVIGNDKVGIIAGICEVLASNGVNVLDISQTVLQDQFFTMVMLVDTSACTVSFAQLALLLDTRGQEMDLSIRIQRVDIFDAMHRI